MALATIITNALVALATVVLAFVAVCQFKTYRRQTTIMASQLAAMDAQVEWMRQNAEASKADRREATENRRQDMKLWGNIYTAISRK